MLDNRGLWGYTWNPGKSEARGIATASLANREIDLLITLQRLLAPRAEDFGIARQLKATLEAVVNRLCTDPSVHWKGEYPLGDDLSWDVHLVQRIPKELIPARFHGQLGSESDFRVLRRYKMKFKSPCVYSSKYQRLWILDPGIDGFDAGEQICASLTLWASGARASHAGKNSLLSSRLRHSAFAQAPLYAFTLG